MRTPVRAVLFGAGGHARMLIDTMKLTGEAQVVGILDVDSSRWKSSMLGVPILGNDDQIPGLMKLGVTHFIVGVAGIGPSPVRARIFETARDRGLIPLSVVHPSAVVASSASLGNGVQIFPGAIVNSCARIGDGVIVNSGAIVEHDCELGVFSHIACGACLAGGVVVEPGAFIGCGATVIQCVRVGANALIAAGALAVADVPAGAKVAGLPARAMS